MEASTCSLLCGDCVQTFDDKESFNQHNCQTGINLQRQTNINKDMIAVQNTQEEHGEPSHSLQADFSITGMDNYIIPDSIKINSTNKGYVLKLKDEQGNGTNDSTPIPDSLKKSEKISNCKRILSINKTKTIESFDKLGCIDKVRDLVNDNFIEESDFRKYNGMPDDFRLNRMMRDRDFKLGRTNFYSFKDTLGDWDERSTQSLIELIQKHPKAHFLLSQKAERRLDHWENIHKEMCSAGYSFTVLQLRMRWREVLRKYRWTVDYNDHHSIKKTCEYMDEMNQLFGEWDWDATMALFDHIKQIQNESAGKHLVRVGFAGWERISTNLMTQGHRFSVYKVEARWRNLVNLYKTMVDHNAMPHVQPYSIAFQEQLLNLVVYEPNRRKRYERQKGKKVTQERFPESATQLLLQLYKDNIQSFHTPSVNNTLLWEEIRQKMEESGHIFPTFKLKDILTGIIKGYENCQYHNSLPGSIRREVPYYRELSEIYDVFRCWPHIKNRRSLEHRVIRKFRLRLQSSQQLWSTDESRTLLQVYPDVLEAHVNQAVSHNVTQQPSDLWLQVAKSYQATGKTRRDVPEIAIHMGLLRQGYIQGNNFPFMDEMRRVKEMEEAVCYSPDVSKFTGDIEVIYWSHDAVYALLDLYIKHQQKTNSGKESVFLRITEDLNNTGYMYTKQQVIDQFQLLIGQYKARLLKTRIKPQAGRTPSIPAGAPYENKLCEIYQLREDLCISWTNNVKSLPKHSLKILLEVSNLKFKEFFSKGLNDKEIQEQMQQVIQSIRLHIKNNKLLEHIPETRQVRHHLIKSLRLCAVGKEDNESVVELLDMLKDYDYGKLLHGAMNEGETEKEYIGKNKQVANIKRGKFKKNSSSKGVTKRKRNDLDSEINHESPNKEDGNAKSEWLCRPDKAESCQENDDIPEYLSISLSCIQEEFKVHHTSCKDEKQESSKDLTITITNSNNSKQNLYVERISKRAKCEDFGTRKMEKEDDKEEKNTNNDLENLKNHGTAETNNIDIYNKIFDKIVELNPQFPSSKEDQSQITYFNMLGKNQTMLLMWPKELKIKDKMGNTKGTKTTKRLKKSFVNMQLENISSNLHIVSNDNNLVKKTNISDGYDDKNASNSKINVTQHTKMPSNKDTLSNIINAYKEERKRDEEELLLVLRKQEEEQEALSKEMLGLFNTLIGKL